ncbi:MAG: hypothetical protein CMA63_02980 [Euryarchaeota archaeon]|nr:hypothetical protein [Euryarchaeota archaeon]
MSDDCEVTGFSPEQQHRWPNVHAYLTDSLELPNGEDLTPDTIERISCDILDSLKLHAPRSGDLKKRQKLFEHLQRSIERRFKGSKLQQFGSSESGLSLGNADLDLCLQFTGEKPKKVLSALSQMLRQQDMEDIVLLTSAKVPIIKFTDERTKIPVDISVNNTLALHNTQLLKSYTTVDERISQCVRAVKHWASQRDVCNAAKGSFSSYAWTLIALQSLQTTTPPVAPNIQAGEKRNTVNVEGKNYDLTMSENPATMLQEANSQSIGAIMVHFFRQLVLERTWDSNVISIRSGRPIGRKEKKWKYGKPKASQAILQDARTRLGKHSFPVEDPFDHEHDLSRVLRPEGALDIQEELFSFWIGLNEGKSWKALCETKNPERFKHLEEKDLFEDLRQKPRAEVDTMLAETIKQLADLEERISVLEEERHNNIRISRALRGLIEETSDLRNEHRTIVRSLRPRSQKMDALQNERNEINSKIGIPLYRIRELIVEVYKNLVGEVDFFEVPSLQREEEQFSWFFELQEMHKAALRADAAHKEFIELVREQKKAVKELKITEGKQSSARKELIHSEPALANMSTEFSEARQFDSNAQSLLKVIQERRKERRGFRREQGRLEAWIRVSSKRTNTAHERRKGGGKKSNKGKSGQADWKPRNNGPKPEEVQQRASSGGTLSLTDLDVLLNSGGLSNVQTNSPSPKSARRAERKKKQSSRNLSVSRGVRGTSKKGKKE